MPLLCLKVTKRVAFFAILLSLICGLTACGFKLRSSMDLPPNLHALYLESNDPYGQATREIRANLQHLGVRFVEFPSEAPVTLNIINSNTSISQTSVGSEQQVSTYMVDYFVTYVLKNSKGRVVVGPKTLTEIRSITMLANEEIENSNKLNEAEENMLREIINKLMFQLTSKQTKNALESLKLAQASKTIQPSIRKRVVEVS